ncbi:MAG TPA: 30S ribosomal protein S16 [Anaerolineae bacterium]|nr:30S ribosomal protein S16 [Anaerolineae bacterium]
MLRIRLSRTGKKKQPSYRVVVADINAKRDGRVVERIGYYNPLVDPIEYRIKEDRALYWLSVGAQPTDAVERLLVKQGTIERLARLRAGESLDVLVAEFDGKAVGVVETDEETVVAETAVTEAVAEESALDEAGAAVVEEETVTEEVEDAEVVVDEAGDVEVVEDEEDVAVEVEEESEAEETES